MLCRTTRGLPVENPSDHRQCRATGSVMTKAVVPDQRWAMLAHGGACPAPGSRPHIHNAVRSCTTRSAAAAVVSHAFIGSTLEKPSVNTGRDAGVCTCP